MTKNTKPDSDADETTSPVEAEAGSGNEIVEVEFEGITFSFPRNGLEWPVKARRAFRRGDLDEGIAGLLGQQYIAAGCDDWTGRKLRELAAKISEEAGFLNPGE